VWRSVEGSPSVRGARSLFGRHWESSLCAFWAMEPALDDALVEEALQRAAAGQHQQGPAASPAVQPAQARPSPAPTVDDPEYLALLEQGRGRDWKELASLEMLCVAPSAFAPSNKPTDASLPRYKSGHDPLGRPVVVVVASRFPAKKVNLDDLLQYFVQVMDPIVRDDYVLVYVASEITKANMPPFAWLRRAYSLFSRKYKKHIQKLYIIHPTSFTKLILKVCPEVWEGKGLTPLRLSCQRRLSARSFTGSSSW
jgi:hypothetical protein